MKKFLFILAAVAAVTFASCTGCKKDANNGEVDSTKVDSTKQGIVVEDVISANKDSVVARFGRDYRWFETDILLNDYMDSDSCDGSVAEVTSVFQYVEGDDKTFDTYVIFAVTKPDTTYMTTVHDFWMEDYDMSKEKIKVTFEDAYQKMSASNYEKPHGRHCVLRNEIGPKSANPQYIFGNSDTQIYVDAITGDVSDKNPAFESLLNK